MIPKVDNSELGAQGTNKVNSAGVPSGSKGSRSPRAARRVTPSSPRINAQKK